MKRKLIVVLGPTASGKTAFSLSLGERVRERGSKESNIEIINADSRQLYKYMDIGTAKICPDEMCGIPHHLLSIFDPSEEVNIAWYKEYATRVIEDIHSRGNMPMLVGGSMLYISVIIDGLEPNPDRRSGGPPSTAKSPCPYDLRIIGMEVPRTELHRRINERVATLLRSGWVEEVQALLDMGYGVGDPGFKACGYREIAAAIRPLDTPPSRVIPSDFSKENRIEGRDGGTRGDTTPPSRVIPSDFSKENRIEGRDGGTRGDTSNLCDIISAKTRQYAKRQVTWWKYDTRIRWINPEVADFQSLAAELRAFVESSPRHLSAR